MVTNYVVKFFEGMAKFFYALLPTVLPYSTPLPIAMITASSAETFFGMTPMIAGVFVFSLEGLGVWSTTTFIDKFVEWIRSRNPKVFWMSAIMFLVVVAYIAVLIMLNVVLKGSNSVAYRVAVTLVCFLPFIAGILNGFRKVDLSDADMWALKHQEELAAHERARQDKQELARMRTLAKHGFDPRASAVTTSATVGGTDYATGNKSPADYRDFVLELLEQSNGQLSLREITDRVNKTKRVTLEHSKAKSYWARYLTEWKQGKAK